MRIIVAMTGANGGSMARACLLRFMNWNKDPPGSEPVGRSVLLKGTGLSPGELASSASVVYSRDDQGASIASGSFRQTG